MRAFSGMEEKTVRSVRAFTGEMGVEERSMVQRIVLVLLALAISPVSLADERADVRAIEAAAHAWIEALNARDIDEMVDLATDDVVLMDATQPSIVGKESARVAWRRSLPESGTRVTTTTKELEVNAAIAWRIGALVHERASGQIVTRGQSLE